MRVLILALALLLSGCVGIAESVLDGGQTVNDPTCAAGRRYVSGPHNGQCWMP